MKLFLITLIILLLSVSLKAQHCNWCFTCCNFLIVENNDTLQNDNLKIYLTDINRGIIYDAKNDTIFLASQQYPFKSEVHSIFPRRDDLRNIDTLLFEDFNDKKYFIGIIQICNIEDLALCIENMKNKEKKYQILKPENFNLMCHSYFKISDSNSVKFEEYELQRVVQKIVKIY